MALAKQALLTVVLAAALSGCAGPRYQTLYRYEPPADPAGRSCLARCEQAHKTCTDDCRDGYAACSEAVEPEARALHADALKRYEDELRQYRNDLDRYHLNSAVGWGHRPGWYGAGWYDPGWPYGAYTPYYRPPHPPQQPSYSDALRKIRAQRCDRDCGCQANYDTCFLGCGGLKVPEVRCIANCPREPE